MEELNKLYSALGDATPLKQDCGKLCGAACCVSDEDGQGDVLLLACEYESLKDRKWAEVSYRGSQAFLMCRELCERDARPFACRIFPLAPKRKKDGAWTMKMDSRSRVMCPLYQCGKRGLDPGFVKMAKELAEALSGYDDGVRLLEALEAGDRAFADGMKELEGAILKND